MTKKFAYVSGTDGQYRLVLEREAINVFGVNHLFVGTNGARALPVEFGKFRPAQALATAINQYMAPATTPLELMRQAVKAGATLSDYVQAYAEVNPLSDEDQALIELARERYHVDGDLEFDYLSMISGGDDPSGDYVLCWKWVERE